MSCLDPQEIEVTIDLEEWHTFETWYESRTGQSSLVQICRMVNYILPIFDRPAISFHRIGTTTTDTVLAGVDYDGNPTWNPLYDFRTILDRCIDAVYEILAIDEVSEDCIIRYPTDRTSVLTAFNLAVAGLNVELKEDWQQYIEAIRTALETVSASNITIPGMPTTTLSIVSFSDHARESTYTYGMHESSSVYTVHISQDEWTFDWGLPDEGQKNPYSAIDSSCGSTTISGVTTNSGWVGAHFISGDNGGGGNSNSVLVGTEPDRYMNTRWFSAGGDEATFCESPLAGMGWRKYTTSTVTFRVVRVGDAEVIAATDGLSVEWHITASNLSVSVSFSASSGSFSWPVGVTTVDVVITTTLVDPGITDNEWPEDFDDHKCYPVFHLDTTGYEVCLDGCGDYVNPSEE